MPQLLARREKNEGGRARGKSKAVGEGRREGGQAGGQLSVF